MGSKPFSPNRGQLMKLLASIGNAKLSKETIILNITSATECVSKKLGFCKIPDKCYAYRDENRWPNSFKFRTAQTTQWDNTSSSTLASMINRASERHRLKYMRFSEAGDFRSQSDVDKMDELAGLINIRTYGYTARRDLDFSHVRNMTVNGSGFMVHNKFTRVPEVNEGIHCKCNCKICTLCTRSKGLDIKVKYH